MITFVLFLCVFMLNVWGQKQTRYDKIQRKHAVLFLDTMHHEVTWVAD